jgi:hypothetical protein
VELQTGREITFTRFEQFVTAPPLDGLGTTLDTLRRLCRGHDEVERLLVAELAESEPLAEPGEKGNGRRSVDPIKSTQGGTEAEYLAARLVRDARTKPAAAAVLARMRAGEFTSMKAAARAAGIVQTYWSVPADDVEAAAGYLRRHLSPAARARLAALLAEPDP